MIDNIDIVLIIMFIIYRLKMSVLTFVYLLYCVRRWKAIFGWTRWTRGTEKPSCQI